MGDFAAVPPPSDPSRARKMVITPIKIYLLKIQLGKTLENKNRKFCFSIETETLLQWRSSSHHLAGLRLICESSQWRFCWSIGTHQSQNLSFQGKRQHFEPPTASWMIKWHQKKTPWPWHIFVSIHNWESLMGLVKAIMDASNTSRFSHRPIYQLAAAQHNGELSLCAFQLCSGLTNITTCIMHNAVLLIKLRRTSEFWRFCGGCGVVLEKVPSEGS